MQVYEYPGLSWVGFSYDVSRKCRYTYSSGHVQRGKPTVFEQPGLSWVGLYEVSVKCRVMAPPGHEQITALFYIFIFGPHHARKP